jgi:NADP-dependent 3-hydroxy acid dehydrogenase YdfG
MKTLDGKVAVVTGGSMGIGLAIGRRLAEEGAAVILAARTPARLDEAAEGLRKDSLAASGIAADVSREEDVERLIETVMRRHGRIDILVNNAGMGVFKPVAEMSPREFDTMWETNMRGAFLTTRAALPHMIKARSGELVFIASLAGKNSFKGGAGYCATKWGLRGFASSLMLEVREHNIRVATIFPGSVDTSFSTTGKRGEQITQPRDVADAVLFAVTAPARSMFSEIDVRPTNPSPR